MLTRSGMLCFYFEGHVLYLKLLLCLFLLFIYFSFSYRQAQATVLQALPLLNGHGIATKRPDDYFAEMAKSDQHMQKVTPWAFFLFV